MSTAGIIDIGSNSVRFLVVSCQDKELRTVYRDLETTRLAGGMGQDNTLNVGAQEATVGTLQKFKQKGEKLNCSVFKAVATSAVREALNKDAFLARIFQATGLQVEVISGRMEAELSFAGASCALDCDIKAVVDVGGGSTEVIFREDGGLNFYSLSLGAVKHLETKKDYRQVLASLKKLLPAMYLPQLVAVGGTPTSLIAVKKKLTAYDPHLVHGQKLAGDELESILNYLKSLTLQERRNLPGLPPGREDIIIPGTEILKALMEVFSSRELIVSEAGLLYGLAAELFPEAKFVSI